MKSLKIILIICFVFLIFNPPKVYSFGFDVDPETAATLIFEGEGSDFNAGRTVAPVQSLLGIYGHYDLMITQANSPFVSTSSADDGGFVSVVYYDSLSSFSSLYDSTYSPLPVVNLIDDDVTFEEEQNDSKFGFAFDMLGGDDRDSDGILDGKDFNGDSIPDIIIGDYEKDGDTSPSNQNGRVYLYFGNTNSWSSTTDYLAANADVTFIGPSTNYGYVGYAVALADVNGDNIGDALIGAPGIDCSTNECPGFASTLRLDAGRVYIVYGATSYNSGTEISLEDVGFTIPGRVLINTTQTSKDQLGYSLDSLGDLNDDGQDDLIIGGPGYDSEKGRVYVVYSDLLATASSAVVDINSVASIYTGENAGDFAGFRTIHAGDTNGNGKPDALVGARDYSTSTLTEAGRTYLIFPSSSSSTQSNNLGTEPTFFGLSANENAAYPFPLGDINNDGKSDFAVGAPWHDTSASLDDVGKVYIFLGQEFYALSIFGNPPYPILIQDASFTGTQDGGLLGHIGGGIGDWDEDGCDDFTLAHVRGGPSDNGRVYLLMSQCWAFDQDADGFTMADGDCDDSDAQVYPGATEVCDTVDNDCDDSVDYVDLDGDNFEGCDVSIDCDDTNPLMNSQFEEMCDELDNDCNGIVDDDCVDADTDADEDGITVEEGDCDDSDASIYPGALETCGDEINNDCDADGADEDCVIVGEPDVDDDEDSWTEMDGDCSDATVLISPWAVETCDGVDNNCNGETDEGCVESIYEDDDGDGYTEEAGDCDDADATISPAATEVEDTGIDEDCDGLEDDGSIIPPSDTTPPETDPGEDASGSSSGCGCDLYGNRSINSSQLVMLGMFLMGIGMILVIRRSYAMDK